MKKKILNIGMIVFIAMYCIDRFIYSIPDSIYIPIGVLSLSLIIYSIFLIRNN